MEDGEFMHLVSIIMPAYNAAGTIAESIDSVLAQTYQNWELLIINDASTDATHEKVQSYVATDNRIRYISNDTNQGIAATRNRGIAHANGDYLAFLDSDDMWVPQKLDKQLQFMMEKNATISYTATSYITASGSRSSYILQAREHFTYKDLLRHNTMSCSSVMIKRDAMQFFSSGFMHEDYAVWLNIVKATGQAHGFNEPLLIYRLGHNTNSSNRIKSAVMTYKTYRHVGYGIVTSALYTLLYAKHSISKRRQINNA